MSTLGKGLSALFGELSTYDASFSDIRRVPIEQVISSPNQPRRSFDDTSITKLADSIKKNGVLQPIIVRQHHQKYQIVAGERRWRACKEASLLEIPIIVRQCSDEEMLGLALIENLQREDLNAIDEADSFQKLMQTYGHTQDEVAKLVSKSRSYVTNALRLLTLDPSVQQMVKDDKLTASHARCLVGIENAQDLAQKIEQESMSVRDTENLVREKKKDFPLKKEGPSLENHVKNDTLLLSDEIAKILNMPTSIQLKANNSGNIHIQFKDLIELDTFMIRIKNAYSFS